MDQPKVFVSFFISRFSVRVAGAVARHKVIKIKKFSSRLATVVRVEL